LQLLGSAAYIDSRVLDENNAGGILSSYPVNSAGPEVFGTINNRVPGVARFGGSFWATYNTAPEPLRGLKLGLGAIARGAREGDNGNDYSLPGFVRWNALAAYRWSAGRTRLTLQLNVDNLFNKRYFESVSGTYIVMPEAPRRWLLSVSGVLN
jgi:iron complex outermembrane receptor protein